MTARYLLREQHNHLIIPRPDLGLFCSRKNAKRAAKRRGFPLELIHKVSRHENEDA